MGDKRRYIQPLNSYARYSSMAFQMIFIIALGVFGGIKVDQWLDSKPWFTLICTLAGIGIALYVAIKDALRSNSSKHGKDYTH